MNSWYQLRNIRGEEYELHEWMIMMNLSSELLNRSLEEHGEIRDDSQGHIYYNHPEPIWFGGSLCVREKNET